MIDFNKTRQYTLSIRLSTDGFCFAVHNPQAVNEYTFQPYRIDTTKSVAANLKVAVKELNMLRHTYGAVNILLVNTPYTLVPIEFYAEQYEREFYQQNIASSTSNTTIIHNVVADEQMVVVFAIENQLHKYITTQFPKAVIHAGISPLINFGFERSSMTNKRYCLLHLHKHAIDFLCYDKTSPLFANTFHYSNTEDAVYYLLNCWSILSMSQTDDTLHIVGQQRATKALLKELTLFIQNIHIIRPAEEFHSTELARVDEMPFDLQSLIACE